MNLAIARTVQNEYSFHLKAQNIMNVKFDPKMLKGHYDPNDKILRILRDSELTDDEIELLLAAYFLAFSTTYPKKYKKLARECAKKSMKTLLPGVIK